jgi:hypothetical protein
MTEVTRVVTPADDEIKDFTRAPKRIRFKIDADIFEGMPGLPVMQLVEFAAMAEEMETASVREYPELFSKLFALVLTEQSYGVFMERLDSREKPIDFQHLNGVMPYLLGEYGMRPTEPSSDSSPGSESPDGGTNSMVSAPPLA